MNPEHLTRLIELLASTDTLWRPIRRNVVGNRLGAAIAERREQFEKYGLPFQLGGGDDASRKSAERLAARLEQSPDVVFRRRRGKRMYWRLTDAGDWRLRSLCGSFGVAPMLVGMIALRCHQGRPHEPDDNIVSEKRLQPSFGPRKSWGKFMIPHLIYT